MTPFLQPLHPDPCARYRRPICSEVDASIRRKIVIPFQQTNSTTIAETLCSGVDEST